MILITQILVNTEAIMLYKYISMNIRQNVRSSNKCCPENINCFLHDRQSTGLVSL